MCWLNPPFDFRIYISYFNFKYFLDNTILKQLNQIEEYMLIKYGINLQYYVIHSKYWFYVN